MKFNTIIGNPPYNNDIYLDFVQLGFKLSSDYTLMITPAKWQAKGGKKNELFRKTIVPHMSRIVMYRDAFDIFDARIPEGVSYYIVDKDFHTDKDIMGKCKSNKAFEFPFEKHDEKYPVLYSRKILNIIGKVGQLGEGFKQSLYVKNTDHGESSIAGQLGFKRQTFVGEQDRGTQEIPEDYVEVMQGENVCGYKKKSELFTQYKLDKWKVTTAIMPVDVGFAHGMIWGGNRVYVLNPNQVPKGSFPVVRYFDNEDEAKSFQSYVDTRLYRLLNYIGMVGATTTKEFFRFIPDQPKYEHIFTDQELYSKYNLTQEEINIIESVIKERKSK